MKSVRQRRLEQQNARQQERERRKRSRRPVTAEVEVGDYTLNIVLSEKYAPILKKTGDTKLIDIANKYKLPLTEEQRFLLESGDTFLSKYTKKIIPEEEQMSLYAVGWNPLVSSNLKAVKVEGEDLKILFHSDAVYKYPGKANMYYPFSEAMSPGRLLWRTIRTMRGYQRVA
jgi:hypothetical protein